MSRNRGSTLCGRRVAMFARVVPVTLLVVLGLTGCTAAAGRPSASAGHGTSSASPAAGPSSVAGTSSAGPTAADVEPFGAHWDWSRYQQFAPYLRTLAGSTTFYELVWCGVEPSEGTWDWSQPDQVANLTRQLHITLQIKIRVGVCWATGGTAAHVRGADGKTESAMPADLGAYGNFVRAVVARYAPYGVHEYAIENEVNSPSYFSGSPADYERLARTAAAAIRAADPHALVADSGISSVAAGMGLVDRLLSRGQDAQAVTAYRTYFQLRIGTRGQQIPNVTTPAQLRTALATAANSRNLQFLDATRILLADGTFDLRQVHFYEPSAAVPVLLDYLRATTPAGMPVQAWEVGQFDPGGATGAASADDVVKTVTEMAAGGVGEVCWLPLAYNPDNRDDEQRYGLLDPDGTPRDAGRAVAALATAARGATISALPPGSGLSGMALTGSAGTTLVLWSSSGAPVTVPAPPGGQAGPVGGPLQPLTAAITVTAMPLLLRAGESPSRILDGAGPARGQ